MNGALRQLCHFRLKSDLMSPIAKKLVKPSVDYFFVIAFCFGAPVDGVLGALKQRLSSVSAHVDARVTKAVAEVTESIGGPTFDQIQDNIARLQAIASEILTAPLDARMQKFRGLLQLTRDACNNWKANNVSENHFPSEADAAKVKKDISVIVKFLNNPAKRTVAGITTIEKSLQAVIKKLEDATSKATSRDISTATGIQVRSLQERLESDIFKAISSELISALLSPFNIHSLLTLTASPASVEDIISKERGKGKKALDDLMRKGNKAGMQPLHVAARQRNIEIVKLLLKNGAPPCDENADGQTPLDIAIDGGAFDIVVALYKSTAAAKKVKVAPILNCPTEIVRTWLLDQPEVTSLLNDSVDSVTGKTLLHKAALLNEAHLIEELAKPEREVLIDISDNAGRTPLMDAVSSSSTEAVRHLISADADVHATDSRGMNIAAIAVAEAKVEVVREVVAYGVDLNAPAIGGNTPAHFLAMRTEQVPEVVEVMKQCNVDFNALNETGGTPLHMACYAANSSVASVLLHDTDIGVNPDVPDNDGRTPLMAASMGGSVDVISQVLQTGKVRINAVDKTGQTALFMASNPNVSGVLVQAGVAIDAADQNGDTAVLAQARKGRDDVAASLIDRGADIEVTNKSGETVLHAAARGGAKNTMTSALKRANSEKLKRHPSTVAFVNKIDLKKRTALHDAAGSNQPAAKAVTDTLLQAGADPAVRDASGNVPLHHAAAAGNRDVAIQLIQKAPELINATNNMRDTALHVAIQDSATVKALVDSGIDVTIRNQENASAAKVASDLGLLESEIVVQEKSLQLLGALHGDITVGLAWFNFNDLDIHCLCSCGNRISFYSKICNSCHGNLDVDMNVGGRGGSRSSDEPKEHISWQNPPNGIQRIEVRHYSCHEPQIQNCEFKIWLNVQNQTIYAARASVEATKVLEVFSFEVANGQVKGVTTGTDPSIHVERDALAEAAKAAAEARKNRSQSILLEPRPASSAGLLAPASPRSRSGSFDALVPPPPTPPPQKMPRASRVERSVPSKPAESKKDKSMQEFDLVKRAFVGDYEQDAI